MFNSWSFAVPEIQEKQIQSLLVGCITIVSGWLRFAKGEWALSWLHTVRRKVFAINHFREFREWSKFAYIIIIANFMLAHTRYIWVCTNYWWCHIKMANVDGSFVWWSPPLDEVNGIIVRFSRMYITMGRYLHIIQCKTIRLSTHLKMETVRRLFAVVITFPQLKCTSN